jgi:hypothetical protein
MDRRRTGWATTYPDGLCGDRTPHLSHEHHSETLGWFWCAADEDDREPYRSERRRLVK